MVVNPNEWTAFQRRVADLEEQHKKLAGLVTTLANEVTELKKTRSNYQAFPAPSPDNGKVAELEKEVSRLTADNDALQEQVTELTAAKADLQKRFGELNADNADLQAQYNALERDNAALGAKLEPFSELLDIYDRYRTLELVKADSEWREILPTDTPSRFLLCGGSANAITSLWEKMRNACECPGMTDSPEWAVLLDVLRFLLKQYNSTMYAPVWEWMDDRAGDRFDGERHIRAKGGSQHSGNVAKVLLPGIWNRKEKKAARKCVVTVGEQGGMSS